MFPKNERMSDDLIQKILRSPFGEGSEVNLM
jgi:hypothetical protein